MYDSHFYMYDFVHFKVMCRLAIPNPFDTNFALSVEITEGVHRFKLHSLSLPFAPPLQKYSVIDFLLTTQGGFIDDNSFFQANHLDAMRGSTGLTGKIISNQQSHHAPSYSAVMLILRLAVPSLQDQQDPLSAVLDDRKCPLFTYDHLVRRGASLHHPACRAKPPVNTKIRKLRWTLIVSTCSVVRMVNVYIRDIIE